MPRITLEKKVPLKGGVVEIITNEYELPGTIFYQNKVLSYDSYQRAYVDNGGDTFIFAVDYLKFVLEQQKQEEEPEKE